jgi:hypothetical protein
MMELVNFLFEMERATVKIRINLPAVYFNTFASRNIRLGFGIAQLERDLCFQKPSIIGSMQDERNERVIL